MRWTSLVDAVERILSDWDFLKIYFGISSKLPLYACKDIIEEQEEDEEDDEEEEEEE